ncbi:MAG: hypothetical protein WDM89_01250 [Rhizomicrobium sp.]
MNRFTTVNGFLNGSNNIVAGSSGTLLTYDYAGERKTAVSANGTETDTYTYNLDGTLTSGRHHRERHVLHRDLYERYDGPGDRLCRETGFDACV